VRDPCATDGVKSPCNCWRSPQLPLGEDAMANWPNAFAAEQDLPMRRNCWGNLLVHYCRGPIRGPAWRDFQDRTAVSNCLDKAPREATISLFVHDCPRRDSQMANPAWHCERPGSVQDDAERMREHMLRGLCKADHVADQRPGWKHRQQARATLDIRTAWQHYDAGRRGKAAQRLIQSFILWPLPLPAGAVEQRVARLRLLAALGVCRAKRQDARNTEDGVASQARGLGWRHRLRTSHAPGARVVRCLVRSLYQFSVPPVGPLKWLYRSLYWMGHGTAEFGRRFLAGVLWKPLFIARCSRVGRNLRLEQLPWITGSGDIELGDDVEISGKISIHFSDRYQRPRLTIGDHVFVGHGSSFFLAAGITIGAHTLIAGRTSIRDNDGHPLEPALRRERAPVQPNDVRPVVIGENVWLGSECLVMKGVHVGDNAVVAARSVVTHDVPPNTIVAGIPARAVRTLDTDTPDDTCS